jgi:ribosomal-protein-serine acetyltransferase
LTTRTEYHIRSLNASDAPSLCAAVTASLPELCDWMPWCRADYSLVDAQSWISFTEDAWANRSEFPFGVFDRATGQVIGGVGINQINKTFRFGNLGYWVSKPYLKHGVATFAAKQAALFAFEELGLTRLEIVTTSRNYASQRVAERLGAVRECVARNRLYFHEQLLDAVVYSLIPGDFVG